MPFRAGFQGTCLRNVYTLPLWGYGPIGHGVLGLEMIVIDKKDR